MVCKNCGADLKPGIKYCLECGSYIEDEDEELEEEETKEEVIEDLPTEPSPEATPKKKKKKVKLSVSDYLIYAGLLLIMIASIVVIIVVLTNNSKTQEPAPQVVQPAKTISIGNYKITIPAGLESTPGTDSVTVSDNTNYTFTFMLREDEYDVYQQDHSIIEDQLKGANYIVNSVAEKEETDRQFLVYDFQEEKDRRIFYLTKINSKYTAMGVISTIANGNWERALPVINKISNSLEFKSK